MVRSALPAAAAKRDEALFDLELARFEYHQARERLYRCDHCGGVMDNPAQRPVKVHRPTENSDPGLLTDSDMLLPDLLIYCGTTCFHADTDMRRKAGRGFLEGLIDFVAPRPN